VEGFDASEDGTGRGTPLIPAVSPALKARDHKGPSSDGDGDGAPILPVFGPDAIAFSCKDYAADAGEVSPTLRSMNHDGSHANGGGQVAIAIQERSICDNPMAVRRLTPTECERLQGFPADYTLIPHGKRLKAAAREDLAAYFERTGQYMKEVTGGAWVFDREAFEAAWPAMAADGPRYKALGNSMAVNVMSWIGERIALVDAAMAERDEAA